MAEEDARSSTSTDRGSSALSQSITPSSFVDLSPGKEVRIPLTKSRNSCNQCKSYCTA